MFHVKHSREPAPRRAAHPSGGSLPTGPQRKSARPSGAGASRFDDAAYTSATHKPWMLQYSYTLRASSPSATAKSATGASSGVSSTIW